MATHDIAKFHPDLQTYFDGKMLDHPLLRQLSPNPKYANEMYNYKKAEIDVAIQNKDWHSFVFLHERPYRVMALKTLTKKHKVALDRLWPLIGHVWSDTEFPMDHADFWRKIWASTCPHRKTVMSIEDRLSFDKMPKKIVVWRGVNDSEAIPGFSWSLQPRTAAFFARRFSHVTGEPLLAQGVLKKHHAVAYFGGRKEAEVVTLPEPVCVIDIQVLPLTPEVAE
jgi:hypothetical protein